MSSFLFAFIAIVQQWAAASRPAVSNLPNDAILLYSPSRCDAPTTKLPHFYFVTVILLLFWLIMQVPDMQEIRGAIPQPTG